MTAEGQTQRNEALPCLPPSLASPTPAQPATTATGPRTDAGKAVAARNAVTHGLHSKEVVLPHLGEEPPSTTPSATDSPGTLPPHRRSAHYVTQIAQALWRLAG